VLGDYMQLKAVGDCFYGAFTGNGAPFGRPFANHDPIFYKACADAAPSLTLSATPNTVAAGGSVMATWSGIPSPTALDWIGVFAPGSPNTAYLAWVYVSCSQTPTSPQAAGACALTIPPGLAPGTYELRLLANNGYTALATSGPFAVTAPGVFDYALGNSGAIAVSRGSGGSNTITATLLVGGTQPVTLSASGLPAGATASFATNPCSPTCASQLTITTTTATPTGTFPITVTGAPLGHTTGFNLIVTGLSASPATLPAGGTVTATWGGIASPSPTDWIGLYAAGAPDTAYLAWIYVSCSQMAGGAMAGGSCAFTIPSGVPAGTYELRLLANNGYTRLARGNALTVGPAGPGLGVSPPTSAAGGVVTATWSAIPSPSATDWIGLYQPGAPNTAYLAWIYVSCSQAPGGAMAGGSCAFTIPNGLPPGTYELRLLSNNGYTSLATSNPLTVN
jgi:hypothetical protein